MQPQPEGSVSARNAWRAAVARAQRGTEALITVEAQVLELEEQLAQAGAEIQRLRKELEERGEDATQDEGPGAESVGEAVPTPPFLD